MSSRLLVGATKFFICLLDMSSLFPTVKSLANIADTLLEADPIVRVLTGVSPDTQPILGRLTRHAVNSPEKEVSFDTHA